MAPVQSQLKIGMILSQLGVNLTPMISTMRWTGAEAQKEFSVSHYLPQVWLSRPPPWFSAWHYHTACGSCVCNICILSGRTGGFPKVDHFLSDDWKGFPDHGRCRQQWRAIEHRVVLAVKEEMDTGGKSSTVRFTVKTIITVAINNTSNNYFSHACNHS